MSDDKTPALESPTGNGESANYTPATHERKAFEALHAKMLERYPAPAVTVTTENGQVRLGAAHNDPTAGVLLQAHALGLTALPPLTHMLRQMVEVTQQGGARADYVNEMFSMVEAIGPTDIVESMLATQMVTIHDATMTAARHLHGAETMDQVELYGKQAEKLSRTFATLTDTLKGYRSKVDQRVVVEHKHYHLHQDANGEATGGQVETEHKPHERSISQRQAVHGHLEANGAPMQGAGGDRVVSLPVSRSPRRSAVRAGA